MTERNGPQTPEATPEQNRATYLAVVGSGSENSLFLSAAVSAAVSGYDAYATVATFSDCGPQTLAALSDPACCYDIIISADPACTPAIISAGKVRCPETLVITIGHQDDQADGFIPKPELDEGLLRLFTDFFSP